MSASETTAAAAGPLTSATLAPGAAPIGVATGTADVFALLESGVRFPIATVHQGASVPAADADITLVVVARQGASLTTDVPTPQFEEFAQAVRGELGESAAALDSSTPQALTAGLSTAVLAAEAAASQAWHRGMSSSIGLSESLYETALNRIETSSETLDTFEVQIDDAPLIKVMRILGVREGFEVTAPTVLEMTSTTDPLRLVCHKSSLRARPILLDKGWHTSGRSSYLGTLTMPGEEPVPVAIVYHSRGYLVQGPDDAMPRHLTSALLPCIDAYAHEIYPPMPVNRAITIKDVIRMGMRGSGDLWFFAALMALLVAVIGLITPILTQTVVGAIVPQGASSLLVQVGLALTLAAAGCFAFTLVQNYTVSLISQRATLRMQSAFWDRVLSMPAGFFRGFNSGDLTVRVLAVDSLQSLVSAQVVSASLAAIFGFVNLFLMFRYDVLLGFVGTFFLVLSAAILVLGVRAISAHATDTLVASRKANGWVVQMLSGIMKIRIANAESRMEALYLDIAREQTVAGARQTVIIGRLGAWFAFAASGASALFYLVILLTWQGSAPISTATFLAFTSAFSMAFAGVAGLSALVSPLANAGPTLNLLAPIMESLPESAGHRQDPGVLDGRIELRDVKFRYTPDSPLILQGLSLTVEPRTMVALVGTSGAGKSTVTRLLLGFETPEDGQILYDGRSLSDLDLTLVRRQMGVVVQSGTILRASVMQNIVGSVSSDIDAAWAAAESAAIADDIRAMPMGMQTIVDPANISGGQAQRILLARALVNHPSILILDEATSALDNESQAIVTKAMKELDATRIVIAHRLSTIRSADRIVVLDKGVVVEQGTYDELMALNGVFVEQVKRQVN